MQFYKRPNLLGFGERWHREKEKPDGLVQWVFNAASPFCGREKMQSWGEVGQDSVVGPAMLYIMLVQGHRLFLEIWSWISVVLPPCNLSDTPG